MTSFSQSFGDKGVYISTFCSEFIIQSKPLRYIPSLQHRIYRRVSAIQHKQTLDLQSSVSLVDKVIATMSFIISQLFTRLPYPKHSFSGQTVIVTGSNTGLGLEAARHFTRLDAGKVILAVRTQSKGEAAKESIEKSTNRKGVVEVWYLDLGSYESVKEFANKAEKLDRLDILVENAGIARRYWSVLEDNEATITTNVVSTFLLGILLLPKMRETGQKFNIAPHLSITCSEVHSWSPFKERNSESIFGTLNDKETADMADR